MFTLHCGHDSGESFRVQGPVYDNMLIFKVGPLALPQSWETTPCQLSAPTYEMYRVLILFSSYFLPLPAALHHVWAVS